jgi:amino-acid N-acetyltransferase
VAPYVHAHRGKTIAVASAGELVAAGKLNLVVQDMAILHAMGIKPVLVHGLRPQVGEQLRAKGRESKFSHSYAPGPSTASARPTAPPRASTAARAWG